MGRKHLVEGFVVNVPGVAILEDCQPILVQHLDLHRETFTLFLSSDTSKRYGQSQPAGDDWSREAVHNHDGCTGKFPVHCVLLPVRKLARLFSSTAESILDLNL